MRYLFEDLELDPDRRELRRGSELVPIEPQIFDLLLFLIRNRDRVVSKDDMIAAVWGGRIISESTLSSRITDLRHAVGDSGEQQRMIRTIPRRGFRFVGDVLEGHARERDDASSAGRPPDLAPLNLRSEIAVPSGRDSPSLPLPDRPSLVVLPFANHSGDPAQDYFADGMVEDITIALGRLPWLFVIGSGSAFTYKNQAVDPRRVGAELGVRYVLRGSVRKAEKRVRITAQLADATHGGHVWADHFDGEIDDVFEMQDRVATQVSVTIAPALQIAELKRTERKPTENLTAYDLYLRAARRQRETLDQNRESLKLLYRAVELDPTYGAAYGLAAFCFFWQKVLGWVAPTDAALQEGVRLANLAVEHGDNDSEALWMGAQAAGMLGGAVEPALDWLDRAISLNPNSPGAWWSSCLLHMFRGDSDVSLEHASRARRLDPRDPLASTHSTAEGLAHFFANRFEPAAAAAEKVLAREPLFPPALRLAVAANGSLGRASEAKSAVERLRAARPHETVKTVQQYYAAPLRLNPAGFATFLQGLRTAGLPDG